MSVLYHTGQVEQRETAPTSRDRHLERNAHSKSNGGLEKSHQLKEILK